MNTIKKNIMSVIAATMILSMTGIATAGSSNGYRTVREVMVDVSSTPKCYIKLDNDSGSTTWYSMTSTSLEKISWCESIALTALSTGRKLYIKYGDSVSDITRIYISSGK